MKLRRMSMISGQENEMDLPVDEDRIRAWLSHYDFDKQSCPHIQDAFPDLDAEQREFVLTGITPSEWDDLFPPRDADGVFEDD